MNKVSSSALGALVDFGIFFRVVITVHLRAAVRAHLADVVYQHHAYYECNDGDGNDDCFHYGHFIIFFGEYDALKRSQDLSELAT